MQYRDIADRAVEAAGLLGEATSLRCVAVGPDGAPFAPSGRPAQSPCSFCLAFFAAGIPEAGTHPGRGGAPGPGDSCAGVHRYGTYQAERFGGAYLYFCPRNLAHWTSPVRAGGLVVAALVGGPALLVPRDDYLREDLEGRDELAPELRRRLEEEVLALPYVDPGRARALSETTALCAEALSRRIDRDLPPPEAETAPAPSFGRGAARRDGRAPGRYPVSKERELAALIARGDLDGARRTLNEMLGFIYFYSEHDVELVKLRVQELVVLLSRAAMEGGGSTEEIIGLNNLYLRRIQEAKSVYGLSADLSAVLARFVDCAFTLRSIKRSDLMRKALRYLEANYAKALTLEDAAFQVGLSASRFSRLFKEATGETFVERLTRTRLRAAEALLLDRSVPLSDVGARVGFDDQSYFTRVYRKWKGLTPGRFRETKGGSGETGRVDESDIEIHEA